MNTRLSHSSVSKFQECPKAWDYHYNQKLRSKLQSSALCFGSAIDKSLESLLSNKKDPHEEFLNHWTKQYVNKTLQDLPENINIVYSDSDVDLELIDEVQDKYLQVKLGDWRNKYKEVLEIKEKIGFKNLKEENKRLINLISWHSLKTKGDLMITAFKSQILPRITKVLALQKEIELVNDQGDKVIGYADLICEWDNKEIVVLDFKTSTRNYEKESVLVSPQLSLYLYSLCKEYKTRKAGYIVINKKISKNKTKICSVCSYDGSGSRHKTCSNEINEKRCNGVWLEKLNPKVYIQILIDEIPEITENIVMENINFINESIKNKVFHRNFQSCVKPWGKCVYFDLCYKNDKSELIEESVKKDVEQNKELDYNSNKESLVKVNET